MNDKIQHSRPVPPFLMWCSATIPAVFDNSMTYYETLCALTKWLQDNLVNVVNNNASVTEEYINKVNELQEYVENYFANLDVQEEINNKLDEMADDGTLQEIVAAYLNATAIWGFDTVADLKAATNLIAGSYARTMGYYAKNDGGGALYYITETGSADDTKVIAITSGVYANYVYEGQLNIKQFGAKGDGTTDDSAAIDLALAYRGNNHVKIVFNTDESYRVSGRHFIKSNTDIDLQGATILGGTWLCDSESVSTAGYTGITNIKIHNGRFYGATQIIFYHSTDIKVEGIKFEDAVQDGHVFDLSGVKNFECLNCEFIGNKRSTDYFREVIQTDYATADSQPVWGNIGVDPIYDGIPTKNVLIKGCSFRKKDSDDYYLSCIGTHSLPSQAAIENVKIIDCEFEGWFRNCIRFYKINGLLVEGCTFIPKSLQASSIDVASAIDITIGDEANDTLASKNIKIVNNKLISESSSNDKIFVTISEYNSDYLSENIEIVDNYYDCSTANFAVLSNVNKIKFIGNTVNHCVYFISKGTNKVLKNLYISNNNISNFSEIVRSSASETTNSSIEGFYDNSNVYEKTISDVYTITNSTQHHTNCGLSANVVLDNPTTATQVAFDSISNKLVALSTNELRIARFVKNIKVGGIITAKISSGGKIERLRIRIWDRLAGSAIATSSVRFNGLNAGTDWVSLPVPEIYVKDESAKDVGSNDARYAVITDIIGSGTIEIRSEDSSLNITNW